MTKIKKIINIFLYAFLITGIGGSHIFAQVTVDDFDEMEIAKLRYFLLQESAEPGIRNYQQLGIPSMNEVEWLRVFGTSWNSNTLRLTRVNWASLKLAGRMDFSDFPELATLNCPNNSIQLIDVTNSQKLERLDVYTNNLSVIDVTTNPLLNYLRLGFNHISTVDLSNNPNLVFFCCTGNKFNTLDLSDKEHLQTFYCLSNGLRSLCIDNCNALKEGFCDMNQLDTLNLFNLPNLQKFHCSFNGLKSLSFDNCTALEELLCNDNSLSVLDLSDCVNLTKLNCNKNKLTSLSLEGCNNLTTLNCENNMLYSLDISSSAPLSTLSCKNNYLTFITLPLPSEQLSSYTYNPQNPINLESKYDAVDFGGFYRINDFITSYTWKYKYSLFNSFTSMDGVFSFDESYIGETFICEVRNNALPATTLRYNVTLMQDDVANTPPLKEKPLVYASGQAIHVSTGSPVTVSIYSLLGMLIMKKEVRTGYTIIPVESGFYGVVMDDKTSCKLIVR